MIQLHHARAALLPLLVLVAACGPETGQASSTPPSAEATGSYTIEGAVQRPGTFPLDGDLTVFEVVQRAQPDAERGDLAHVLLIRDGDGAELRIVTDVAAMAETGDSTSNVKVEPGDRIEVPSR